MTADQALGAGDHGESPVQVLPFLFVSSTDCGLLSLVLGAVVWFGLLVVGLNPMFAFIIGAVVGYLFGPALASILRSVLKDPSKSDKNDNKSQDNST